MPRESSTDSLEVPSISGRAGKAGMQIVRETRIIHNVKTVLKTHESDEYRRLKTLVLDFIAEGKKEF